MQNATMRAAWVARNGEPVRAVMNLDKAAGEQTLGEAVVSRCEFCGVLGVETFETDKGRRCALDAGV